MIKTLFAALLTAVLFWLSWNHLTNPTQPIALGTVLITFGSVFVTVFVVSVIVLYLAKGNK